MRVAVEEKLLTSNSKRTYAQVRQQGCCSSSLPASRKRQAEPGGACFCFSFCGYIRVPLSRPHLLPADHAAWGTLD